MERRDHHRPTFAAFDRKRVCFSDRLPPGGAAVCAVEISPNTLPCPQLTAKTISDKFRKFPEAIGVPCLFQPWAIGRDPGEGGLGSVKRGVLTQLSNGSLRGITLLLLNAGKKPSPRRQTEIHCWIQLRFVVVTHNTFCLVILPLGIHCVPPPAMAEGVQDL